jgi:preprotein translocase subunit SecG
VIFAHSEAIALHRGSALSRDDASILMDSKRVSAFLIEATQFAFAILFLQLTSFLSHFRQHRTKQKAHIGQARPFWVLPDQCGLVSFEIDGSGGERLGYDCQ